MNKVIIRGRSIDGTVYLDMSLHAHTLLWSWTSDARQATHMTTQEAEDVLPHVRKHSMNKSPDEVIGRLAIITAPRPLTFLQRWRRDVWECVDGYEYIMQEFGSLVNDNYESGPQPTRLGLILLAAYETTFGNLWAMIRRKQCKTFGHGKHWVDESYGGPNSGTDGGYCSRCGWSFHHTYY